MRSSALESLWLKMRLASCVRVCICRAVCWTWPGVICWEGLWMCFMRCAWFSTWLISCESCASCDKMQHSSLCMTMHHDESLRIQYASICINMHQYASICINMHQYASICINMLYLLLNSPSLHQGKGSPHAAPVREFSAKPLQAVLGDATGSCDLGYGASCAHYIDYADTLGSVLVGSVRSVLVSWSFLFCMFWSRWLFVFWELRALDKSWAGKTCTGKLNPNSREHHISPRLHLGCFQLDAAKRALHRWFPLLNFDWLSSKCSCLHPHDAKTAAAGCKQCSIPMKHLKLQYKTNQVEAVTLKRGKHWADKLLKLRWAWDDWENQEFMCLKSQVCNHRVEKWQAEDEDLEPFAIAWFCTLTVDHSTARYFKTETSCLLTWFEKIWRCQRPGGNTSICEDGSLRRCIYSHNQKDQSSFSRVDQLCGQVALAQHRCVEYRLVTSSTRI